MGEHKVDRVIDKKARAKFIRHLLNDIEALELMVKNGLIENDITRIGSEQEFCLVTDNWRPSKKAVDILNAIDDPHFTTELARFNLEINQDPFELKGDCFSQVENQLRELLDKANETADEHDTKVVLTGILPTISKRQLVFDYMTPNPRYWALNDIAKSLRGSDFQLHLKGVDELRVIHDSVLFEACNTSFQMHLQIAPEDFAKSYNWAQAISGPVLGVCANSPMLLGRELWRETRIALFQQSIDTRNSSYALKEQQARVTFGNGWGDGTIADVFKNDIAQYRIILSKDIEVDSLEELEKGNIPKLPALNLHNGTIYRWNRPCYGVGGGKAHIRIENRYIPSGPSIIDEMANFAFWVGLMMGRPKQFDDMPSQMDFRDAKANFVKAARTGKESVMRWLGEKISVRDLVHREMLPIAYSGLENAGVDKKDIDRLLGIIEKRAAGTTGAQWKIRNYRLLRKSLKGDDSLLALTKAIHDNQQKDLPVHEWPDLKESPETHESASLVAHVMSTQLFTVNENDIADLATSIMQWMNIHHVPVENDSSDLCGLLTWTHMKRYKERQGSEVDRDSLVSDIMTKEVVTVKPKTKIKEAIRLMKKNEFGCLPVIQRQQLVGIITIRDVLPFDKD